MSKKKNIMEAIKEEAAETNLVSTENGALGFANCKSDVVDFFYKVSTMRKASRGEKQAAFLKALAEDKDLAFRLLFFSRDIRGGLGERSLFRDIVVGLPDEQVKALLPLIPEYGRWDDVLALLEDGISKDLKDSIVKLVKDQYTNDLKAQAVGKPLSLLGKWLPSIRKVSKDKVKLAKFLVREFGIDERTYRKNLSALRESLRVVEKDMSANNWGRIDFNVVPSKAAKNYREAFKKHDGVRYQRYLDGLKTGESKINAGAIFPYEIVSAYRTSSWGTISDRVDETLEAQWKALPLPKGLLQNAIVVRDGSGSMGTPVGNGKSEAHDVATALAVLMAENLQEPFKDRFITFSGSPKYVDLSGCSNLREKLTRAFQETECANTNIERTMNLILKTAVKNKLPQEAIPTVVIVSDMEFDEAQGHYGWDGEAKLARQNRTLFAGIKEDWEAAGYKLPKMVFWNVASRTGAVPMQENENGVILVSGFSQNIFDMLSGEGSLLDVVRAKLNTPRYDPVSKALATVS